jgi:hypothetical protein
MSKQVYCIRTCMLQLPFSDKQEKDNYPKEKNKDRIGADAIEMDNRKGLS